MSRLKGQPVRYAYLKPGALYFVVLDVKTGHLIDD